MSSHVAKRLLANASLHADGNEAHDLIVGFGNVSVAFYHARDQRVGVLSPAERHVPARELLEAQQRYDWYIRAASRAVCGLVKGKETSARDGATTVEAVSITFRHNDGCVATVHDDFIPAGPQHGLDSLKHTMENTFRTKLMGKLGPNCCQKSGSHFRKTVGFVDVETRPQVRAGMHRGAWLGWRQGALDAWHERHDEERPEVGGQALSQLGWPTIHLEMMVMLVMCKPNDRM